MNAKTSSIAESQSERIARVIFQHAARIGSEQEISELVRLNADLARDLIGAERCTLWLLDERNHQLWTKVAHGTEEIRIPAGRGLVGASIANDEILIINDVSADHRFFGDVDHTRGYQTRSAACMPLRTSHGVIGALQLLNKPAGFTEEDASLLRMMGAYAGSAIEGERLRQEAEAARLLRHELEIASEVQRSLFPQNLQPVRGLEYTGFCRPARFVSGDYYDFMELPAAAFAFTLGDVSGKGVPAAVMMASIQTLFRSFLTRLPSGLSQVVTDLNNAVPRSSTPERYSTLFCALLNPQRNQLTYVNAGHLAPMIVRHSDGKIDRPEQGELPVGLLPSVVYAEHSVEVAPGDLIVCVSDGVFDVQNPDGELWDSEAVDATLRDNRNQPISTIAEKLIQAIDAYAAGSEQFDDITVIVIRIKPD
jgi:phosphoserine phosphatase RsbU/P